VRRGGALPVEVRPDFSHQKDFGRSSTWVATWLRIRFVEIGATW
jgi:hypothetical protein